MNPTSYPEESQDVNDNMNDGPRGKISDVGMYLNDIENFNITYITTTERREICQEK